MRGLGSLAEPGVAGDPAGHDHRLSVDLFGRLGGPLEELGYDGVLKGRQQIEGRLWRCAEIPGDGGIHDLTASGDLSGYVVLLDPAEDGGLQAAEAEIERVAFHLCGGEPHGMRIAVGGESINDGAARVGETEEFRYFVISLSGGVVARFAQQTIGPAFANFEQVRVSTADHERESGVHDPIAALEDHGVDMAFDVIHGYQWKPASEADGLRIGDAYQQRSYEPGSLRDRDGGNIVPCTAGLFHGQAHDGDDGSKMFARCQLGDDAAVLGMGCKLGRDDGAEYGRIILDQSRRGLVAG